MSAWGRRGKARREYDVSALVSTTDRERGALNRLGAKTPERFPLRNIERRAPRLKGVEIRSPRVGVLSALECVKQAPARWPGLEPRGPRIFVRFPLPSHQATRPSGQQ